MNSYVESYLDGKASVEFSLDRTARNPQNCLELIDAFCVVITVCRKVKAIFTHNALLPAQYSNNMPVRREARRDQRRFSVSEFLTSRPSGR